MASTCPGAAFSSSCKATASPLPLSSLQQAPVDSQALYPSMYPPTSPAPVVFLQLLSASEVASLSLLRQLTRWETCSSQCVVDGLQIFRRWQQAACCCTCHSQLPAVSVSSLVDVLRLRPLDITPQCDTCCVSCSLTLNSEDGVVPGALCSLSQLKNLQELRLGDVDGNNPKDINTICDMVSRLTSLHMGYCPRLQVNTA